MRNVYYSGYTPGVFVPPVYSPPPQQYPQPQVGVMYTTSVGSSPPVVTYTTATGGAAQPVEVMIQPATMTTVVVGGRLPYDLACFSIFPSRHVITHDLSVLGLLTIDIFNRHQPARVICQHCQSNVVTITTKETGLANWLGYNFSLSLSLSLTSSLISR
jgi:hypothetical protein